MEEFLKGSVFEGVVVSLCSYFLGGFIKKK